MLDGDWSNGEVFKTSEEASNFLDKEHIAPYKKSNLIIETPFVSGLKEGVEKRYFENGKLRLEDEYKNDKFERRINEYLDDGTS